MIARLYCHMAEAFVVPNRLDRSPFVVHLHWNFHLMAVRKKSTHSRRDWTRYHPTVPIERGNEHRSTLDFCLWVKKRYRVLISLLETSGPVLCRLFELDRSNCRRIVGRFTGKFRTMCYTVEENWFEVGAFSSRIVSFGTRWPACGLGSKKFVSSLCVFSD